MPMNPKGYKRFKQLRGLFKSLRAGSSIAAACKAITVDVSTLWDWRHKSQRLDNLINNIIESRIQIIEDSLFKKAAEGNVKACETFLYNRAPLRWKNPQGINNTVFVQQNAEKKEDHSDAFKEAPRIIFTGIEGLDLGKREEKKSG